MMQDGARKEYLKKVQKAKTHVKVLKKKVVEIEPDLDEEVEDLPPQQEVSPVTQYVSSRDQKPVIIHERTERTHVIPMRVEELPQHHITEPQEEEAYYPPNERVEEPPHRIILVPSHP